FHVRTCFLFYTCYDYSSRNAESQFSFQIKPARFYDNREEKMSKKIVILNGSPRKKGNTSALVKSFTEGAEASGNTVTEFFLGGMNIHGCRGCFGGHSSKDCPCVQQDDMNQIYPAVRDCDVIVLASPLYYWNMSGQLRTAVDRLFALEEGEGNLLRGHGRASALLMAAEGNGFERSEEHTSELQSRFDLVCRLLL